MKEIHAAVYVGDNKLIVAPLGYSARVEIRGGGSSATLPLLRCWAYDRVNQAGEELPSGRSFDWESDLPIRMNEVSVLFRLEHFSWNVYGQPVGLLEVEVVE